MSDERKIKWLIYIQDYMQKLIPAITSQRQYSIS